MGNDGNFWLFDGIAWKGENEDFEPLWKICCSYDQRRETQSCMDNCCIGISNLACHEKLV